MLVWVLALFPVAIFKQKFLVFAVIYIQTSSHLERYNGSISEVQESAVSYRSDSRCSIICLVLPRILVLIAASTDHLHTEPFCKRKATASKKMTQARLELATFRGNSCEANVITNYTIEPIFYVQLKNRIYYILRAITPVTWS